MFEWLCNIFNSLYEMSIKINNEQEIKNQIIEDSLIESYKLTESKNSEIEDAIIELYEMLSESEVK